MPKTKVYVARQEELLPRIGYSVVCGERKIAVFRLSDGRIKALENISPYRQGPLAEGTVSGEYVYCPLYDWKISLLDGQVQEPDHGTVATFETLLEDGKVYVWI
ncbi:nitrite reductase small subunit NirD [Paenibacillus physcomitrellae]|uniref:Assimilatory nitrite reductase [NAD(P)H] small subunit n=1 Tax=Paenibacillus physcomitrellae TaxID=1619311 RepID=A0ABQ1FNZ0_9BACL|nr:nitrite reductase small subunit NirD [Paenibacillus physcomitrellae]GGA24554.1 assimilatory nitrite reductase [NAD(P)H] small subunit [Paenibacillus physcomitrellae]